MIISVIFLTGTPGDCITVPDDDDDDYNIHTVVVWLIYGYIIIISSSPVCVVIICFGFYFITNGYLGRMVQYSLEKKINPRQFQDKKNNNNFLDKQMACLKFEFFRF